MKETAKKKLIKDLIPFAITAVLTLILLFVGLITNLNDFRSIFAEANIFVSIIAFILAPLIMGFEIAGFILGWKWAHERFRAYNIWGLVIKVCIAVFAGYIIFPVVLVKDIIAYVKA